MCGIGGIAGARTRLEVEAALSAMAASLRHRGPDDSGLVVEDGRSGAHGLCAARLAVQDRSPRGHQPMRSPVSGAWIAFNGEIYNVGPLRDRLSAAGWTFLSASDTEVVLAAYEQWGDDFLSHLNGMFALGILDTSRERLLLARDRLGIKPLYYRCGRELIFASEVRALLASGQVSPTLAPEAVRGYLSTGSVRDPDTLIAEVHALPAGHCGVWHGGRFTVNRYWSLDQAFERREEPVRPHAVERIRALLEDAVRRQLISDVPLGVFLSGGVDSSALTGLVASVSGSPPRTVSVVFPERRFSEERFIRPVTERFATRHTEVMLDEHSLLHDLHPALAAMDQPSIDGINTYVVSRIARESGLTVALAGIGGDELFAGYGSFRRVPRMVAVKRRLPGAVCRAAAAFAQLYPGGDRAEKMAHWLREGDGAAAAYAIQRQLFTPPRIHELTNGSAPFERHDAPLNGDLVNAVSRRELDGYMRDTLLRDTDCMSMAHSLEVRVPLLDHELVEAMAALPGRLKVAGRTPKPLLVEALGGLLPREVVLRRKMGFTFPFERWLKGALRAEAEQVLLDDGYGGQVADVLEPEGVRRIWNQFLGGGTAWSRPWALFVLKVWGERWLAAPSAPRAAATA